MVYFKKRLGILALPLAGALLFSGCAAGGGSSDSGTPAAGGTLKVLGQGDLDHYDPQLVGYVPTNGMMRALSRSILSYPASENPDEQFELMPDLAEALPEVSEDGQTYTVTIREGAMWDAPEGARQIVGEDVARGLKRVCNPYQSGSHAGYFQSLIVGMDNYCNSFMGVAAEVDPMKEFISSTEISGVTYDDRTVTFELVTPASDFPYMLTLHASDPAPVEALDSLPDSPEYRANFIASGPYTIAEHVQDSKLVLERNPSWDAATDELRKAYVDSIELIMGVDTDSAVQQVQAGTADMLFDLYPSPANIEMFKAQADPKFQALSNGGIDPFMWFNTKSQNNGGALQKLEVREALQYAVDKAAIVQVLGGESLAGPVGGIFGPGVLGHEDWDPYPTEGSKGDVEKAKKMLAEAGYPDGLTLEMPYINEGSNPDMAQTMQESLSKAGITVNLTPIQPTDYYANFMTNRENAANGVWDIAMVSWYPDWLGGAARSVFQPQFSFDGTPQTYNYVDFNSDEANALAQQALAASTPEEAIELWHEVDVAVMSESPVVNLAYILTPVYHSDRIGDFPIYAKAQNGDYTNVWLSK